MIGQKIKEVRMDNGLTQKDLAKLLNIPQPQMSRIENGKRDITGEMLLKISRGFGKDLKFFDTFVEKNEGRNV